MVYFIIIKLIMNKSSDRSSAQRDHCKTATLCWNMPGFNAPERSI
jgi:hypothetical protein